MSLTDFAPNEKIRALRLNEDRSTVRDLQGQQSRVGLRLRNTITQSIPAVTIERISVLMPYGGDPYRFANNDTLLPILIPEGMGGLYLIRAAVSQSVVGSTRAFIQVVTPTRRLCRSNYTSELRTTTACMAFLTEGESIGLDVYCSSATSVTTAITELAAWRLNF